MTTVTSRVIYINYKATYKYKSRRQQNDNMTVTVTYIVHNQCDKTSSQMLRFNNSPSGCTAACNEPVLASPSWLTRSAFYLLISLNYRYLFGDWVTSLVNTETHQAQKAKMTHKRCSGWSLNSHYNLITQATCQRRETKTKQIVIETTNWDNDWTSKLETTLIKDINIM